MVSWVRKRFSWLVVFLLVGSTDFLPLETVLIVVIVFFLCFLLEHHLNSQSLRFRGTLPLNTLLTLLFLEADGQSAVGKI